MFFTPTPTQDKKMVWLPTSGARLNVTPKKSRKCLIVRTACGVRGPSLAVLSSLGPSAQRVKSKACKLFVSQS